ncbi:amidohydrolase family protein [Streptomyces hygroscopicus]|uniref:amidohydrolase family protein n=1 Tax=Streptomyces hygroscopicus TaxID=1912 RepID=UPI0033C6987C
MDARFLRRTSSGRPDEFGTIFAPDPDWLSLTPPEPFKLDIPVVDAHHHLWNLPGYDYTPHELLADLDQVPAMAGTVYVECASHYRTNGPAEFRPVGETEHVVALTAAAGDPRIAAAIVGFADLDLGDAVAPVLEAHVQAGEGRFRGIRFGTGWDASPKIQNTQTGRRPGMLREETIHAGARRLAALDLSLDVWLFHHQLGDVATLADAVPDLRIVLDHCGGPLGYGPYADDRAGNFALWRAGLREVAARPNVVCKIGGLLARGAAFDYLTATRPPSSQELATIWRPWVETCIEEFGADRCLFESNFPVDKMGVSYGLLWNCYHLLTKEASDGERRRLFAESARGVYRLA